MTSIRELVGLYISRETLSPDYAKFCRQIYDLAPKKGTTVDIGAKEDVFHGLLLGGDEHIMIDMQYDSYSVEDITEKLEQLGVRHASPIRCEHHTRIPYSFEGEKELLIIGGNANNFSDIRGEYSAVMMKGPRRIRGAELQDIVGKYIERLSEGGIAVCSRTYEPDLEHLAQGDLLFEHIGGDKVALSEHHLYRKTHED